MFRRDLQRADRRYGFAMTDRAEEFGVRVRPAKRDGGGDLLVGFGVGLVAAVRRGRLRRSAALSETTEQRPTLGQVLLRDYFWPTYLGVTVSALTARHARRLFGGALTGYVMGWAARRWATDVRLLGVRNSIANVPRIARIRYNAPLLDRGRLSMQAVGLYDIQVAALAYWLWSGISDRRRPPVSVCLPLAAFVAVRLEFVRTPTILYLGASSEANFRLFKEIQRNGDALVLSAIDHRHPRVVAGRPLNVSDSDLAEVLRALPGYDRPQPTNLRTREGKWKATVRALMELAPIIVLDVQIPAEHVLEEVEWIVDRGYAYKTLLVTATTSIGHAELGELGFRTITTDVSSCLRQLRLLTAVPSMLPTPPADVTRPAVGPVLDRDVFAHRRGQLLNLYEKLVAGDQEPNVEGELHELFRPGNGPPTDIPRSDDSARLTMSLDRVLPLLDGWGGRVSLATHVGLDGFAMSEVGYHVNETFLIASSGRDPVPSAARSVLAALIAAEHLRNGDASGSIVTAPTPRIIRTPTPPRTHRARLLRDTALAARLLDDRQVDAAEALERDVRADALGEAELDERLHHLFGVHQKQETSRLTTSVDAALAFARSVELSPSIYINLDGTAWAELGGRTPSGSDWRWTTECVSATPAKALIVEMLRIFR